MVSPRALDLLRCLNRGATLSHEKQDESWRIGNQDVTKHFKACEEIVYLCAVRTLANRGYRKDYVISEEGQRILTQRNYTPIILRRK